MRRSAPRLRDRGGAARQRADGGLRRAWWRCGRSSARPRRSPKDRPADPAWGLWLGPVILAALGLVCGLVPGGDRDALVAPMVLAVSGRPMRRASRALARAGRAAAAEPRDLRARRRSSTCGLDRIRDGLAAAEPRLPRTEGWYDAGAGRARATLAGAVTGAVQNGRMTSYLRSTFLILGLLIWGALGVGHGAWPRLRLSGELIDWAIVGDHHRLDRRGAAHAFAADGDHRARRGRRRDRHRLRASTARSTSR